MLKNSVKFSNYLFKLWTNISGIKRIVYQPQIFGIRSLFISLHLILHWIVHAWPNIAVTYYNGNKWQHNFLLIFLLDAWVGAWKPTGDYVRVILGRVFNFKLDCLDGNESKCVESVQQNFIQLKTWPRFVWPWLDWVSYSWQGQNFLLLKLIEIHSFHRSDSSKLLKQTIGSDISIKSLKT
jgi:hypothetical protein